MQTEISDRLNVITSEGSVQSDALPNGSQMMTVLNQALQASVEADRHFVDWMNDILNFGCPISASDPAYQAGGEASGRATAAKQGFVALWNPIASQFGLIQYSERDL